MATVIAKDMSAPSTVGTGQVDKEVEVAAPEVTEAKPKPSLSAYAQKEKALRQQQRELQAEKEKFRLETMTFQAEEAARKAAIKAKMPVDPQTALAELGLSPEQLTQYLLNQPSPQDQKYQALEEKLARLEAGQKSAEDKMTQAQQAQYEQAKKQIKNEVTLLVDGDETYETIKAMQAEDTVVELIEKTFEKDGVLMSVDDAAKEVEEYLLERAMAIAKLKKIQAKLGQASTEAPQQLAKAVADQKQQSTLSNRIAQTNSKPSDARSRRERAILAYQGLLK